MGSRSRRAKAKALAASRAQGCTCQALVEVRPGTPPLVAVFHDDWCSLLRSHEGNSGPKTQIVLYPERGDE